MPKTSLQNYFYYKQVELQFLHPSACSVDFLNSMRNKIDASENKVYVVINYLLYNENKRRQTLKFKQINNFYRKKRQRLHDKHSK